MSDDPDVSPTEGSDADIGGEFDDSVSLQKDLWAPSYALWPAVSHYYGNYVRQAMLTAAVLMLVGAPFYANPGTLSSELPFIITAAVVVVALAALTNPKSRFIIMLSSVISGVGLILYEWWALNDYAIISSFAFVIRELIAVLFLVAMYFSLKTLRAMIFGQVGKLDSPADFKEHTDADDIEEMEEMK
jgi:hypothetical protein